MTGQADDATETRMRWPGRKRYPAGRIGTRTSSTRPGSSASGAVCERRWVRLRIPAVTWADVPSGATSVSRTTAVATGAETERWRTTSGTPRISTAVSSGSEV